MYDAVTLIIHLELRWPTSRCELVVPGIVFIAIIMIFSKSVTQSRHQHTGKTTQSLIDFRFDRRRAGRLGTLSFNPCYGNPEQ